MYAEVQLQADVLKEAMAKKWWSHLSVVRWRLRWYRRRN
jgi:hypothetical protein